MPKSADNQTDDRAAQGEHWLTPATAMTLSRPILMGMAAEMIMTGQIGASVIAGAAAATDLEGNVARGIDKFFPSWHRGVTDFGAKADKYGDVAAAVTLSAALVAGPRVSTGAKLAAAAILLGEAHKTREAITWGIKYRKQTGRVLDIPSNRMGKWGMALKLGSLTTATVTHDLEPGWLRDFFSGISLTLATGGIICGEIARRAYRRSYTQLLQDIPESTTSAD